MKSLDIVKEGFEGIPAVADALDGDDLRAWAVTKDASLIPHAIAMLKTAVTSSVSMSEASKEVVSGDIFELKATLTPTLSGSAVEWSASPAGIAELSPNTNDSRYCKVKAIAKGSVTITATSNSQTATCALTVTD